MTLHKNVDICFDSLEKSDFYSWVMVPHGWRDDLARYFHGFAEKIIREGEGRDRAIFCVSCSKEVGTFDRGNGYRHDEPYVILNFSTAVFVPREAVYLCKRCLCKLTFLMGKGPKYIKRINP